VNVLQVLSFLKGNFCKEASSTCTINCLIGLHQLYTLIQVIRFLHSKKWNNLNRFFCATVNYSKSQIISDYDCLRTCLSAKHVLAGCQHLHKRRSEAFTKRTIRRVSSLLCPLPYLDMNASEQDTVNILRVGQACHSIAPQV
jgi:hypothetical protein